MNINSKVMAAMYMSGWGIPMIGRPRRHHEKRPAPCARKNCSNLTTHNSGFCSSECLKISKHRTSKKGGES